MYRAAVVGEIADGEILSYDELHVTAPEGEQIGPVDELAEHHGSTEQFLKVIPEGIPPYVPGEMPPYFRAHGKPVGSFDRDCVKRRNPL